MRSFGSQPRFGRAAGALFSCIVALTFGGCAAMRPPDAATPRPSENPYPVFLNDDLARREASLASWRNLVGGGGTVSNPELLPVTATIQNLAAVPSGPLMLPPVGQKTAPTDEELRESIRRFLNSAGPLVCGDLDRLTLVQWIEQADGTRAALYEQRLFRYRMRGRYGKVRVDFATDRRILQLTSTCLPDLDRTQRDLQALRPSPELTPAKIATLLIGKTFTSPNGTISAPVSSADDFTVAEPVFLVRETPTVPIALEFRLAWEVMLKAGFPVYVDAVDGTIIPYPPAA